MIDPMADLGGGAAAGAADASNAKEVFDPMVLNMNLQRVDKIRTFMGILSGCVAGIFGLTGFEGLGKLLSAEPKSFFRLCFPLVVKCLSQPVTLCTCVCFDSVLSDFASDGTDSCGCGQDGI